MKFMNIFLVFLGASLIVAYQDAYNVVQERVERVYVDNSLIDLTCGTYKSNRTTNALNLTAKLKQPLDNNAMIFITGYKWLSNEYRLDILQFHDLVREALRFEYFDIGRLFHNYTTPPFVWPLKPGVTYHMFNWIPDSNEFPPGIPEGRWKLLANITKADRTSICAVNWYFKIEYKIKMFEVDRSKRTRRPSRH